MDETARDVSFCAHTIGQPDAILTVLDATRDPRFAANPLVTGPERIRFYLGCPLLDQNGRPLGALCVIDVEPREWVEAADYDHLRAFAREAAEIIAGFKLSNGNREQALDSIAAQIEELVRAGDESVITELDAMLRRIERQQDGPRPRRA